ncbi:MAG: hypothetical protein RL199_1789 [Pseudomonadota bacterium]|jgi:tetratricopeptide (TPR) repeat protein
MSDVVAALRGRLREAWRLGAVRWALSAVVAAAPLAALLPMAGHLGYEFAALLTLVCAVAAPAAGLALMERPERRTLPTMLEAMALVSAAVAASTLLMALVGLVRPACEPVRGLAFVLLLPLPTALLGVSAGVLARRYVDRRRARWSVVLLLAASLAASLRPLYAGPAFFAFDHFFGWFPGPLYDESVLLEAPLFGFRALTLAWVVAGLLEARALDAEGRARRRMFVLSHLLAGVLLGVELFGGEAVGFSTSDAKVARVLGGLRRVDGLELHFPVEWSDREVERFVADARFRASQVVDSLRLKPQHVVRVWMYRSADEKRRLTGAASTSFSKPWRHEVHVHAAGYPHPVLRHELVHAFGAELAGGPFGVPGGLFPRSPLVEGFAVAFDDEPEEQTLAQWARAMHDEQLAPDVGSLLSAGGFLSASPARAYTYAGAFLRDLQQRYGTPALLDLYAHGDLSKLGPPDALVAAFEKRLAAVPVDVGHRAAAARRYAGRGLVERPCGRESARLVEEAHDLAVRRDKTGVVSMLTEACALDPDDPALLRSLLDAALEAGDDPAAALAEQRLFAHPRLDPGLEARAVMGLGQAAWRRGDLPSARGYFERALRAPVDATTHRQAYIHARVVADDGLAAVTKPLLVEGRADAGVLFMLQDAILARPDDALLPYLLGRQFVQQEAPARGAQLLAARAIGRLGDTALEREAVRLAVRGFALGGSCDAAEELDRTQTKDEADAALAATWVARCRFEQGLRTP